MPRGCDQQQKAITHLSRRWLRHHFRWLSLDRLIEASRFARPFDEPKCLLDIGRYDVGDRALEGQALSSDDCTRSGVAVSVKVSRPRPTPIAQRAKTEASSSRPELVALRGGARPGSDNSDLPRPVPVDVRWPRPDRTVDVMSTVGELSAEFVHTIRSAEFALSDHARQAGPHRTVGDAEQPSGLHEMTHWETPIRGTEQRRGEHGPGGQRTRWLEPYGLSSCCDHALIMADDVALQRDTATRSYYIYIDICKQRRDTRLMGISR